MSLTARIVTDFTSIEREDWERLDHGDNPFVSHAFLAALVLLKQGVEVAAQTLQFQWHRALDTLGLAFGDHRTHVGGFVHLVAGDPNRVGVDNTSQRDDRHLGGAAADIEDHRAARLVHGHAGADRGRHRLVDQVHLAGPGALGGLADRAAFDLGRAIGHANQHSRAGTEVARLVRLANKVLQHLLGNREVGDNAVLQRPDCRDIARGPAQHVLGIGADGFDEAAASTRVLANRDDGRLVEHNTVATRVDQRVGRAEVDRQVIGKITQNVLEHVGIRSRNKINALI